MDGTKHLAGKVVECSTQGRRSGLYRVIFNSDGEAQCVYTILSSTSRWRRRRLWRLSDGKEPSITACCAIRAAIAAVALTSIGGDAS